MTSNFNEKIEERLKKFTEYLNRTKMDHKEYQLEGVRWCLINELRPYPLENIRGGFIADEMGLGKTIMVIGLMISNFKPKTLIVLPPVLINQWFMQILKTTGHKALIYYGENKKKISIEKLNSACIVITSYGGITLPRYRVENTLTPLHEINWSRIVFDEAHHLRNKSTLLHSSAKLLKSDICWLVSGTPIQNKKSDFYNLCSILKMPASFYKNQENITAITKNFILKRTKKQVGIELEDISSTNNLVNWKNKKEMEFSEEIHSALAFTRVKSKGNVSICPKIIVMLRAKQMCVMPSLMKEKLRNLVKLGVISDYNYFEESLKYSSKIDFVIKTIISRKDNGKGKIVFCHYRDEIDEIAMRLEYIGGIKNIARIDGRVNNSKRNVIVNGKNDVLILQIQTGCEGLNLQENYSEIYFVSPHWNPAVEDQAIARCHRIGQKNIVSVFKFQMSGFVSEQIDENGNKIDTLTMDKYVNEIQDLKREMANKLIGN